MWDPYAEFESATLPNGLTVYSAYWPERPWEAMGFLIHNGAEHDPVGLEGLSHFVEHLVSGNTIISKKEISAFFEDCGGMVSLGTTGYPYTHYRFFVPTDKEILSRAFSIFGHMLLSAKLERSVESEREIVIGEFNRHYPIRLKLDLDVRERKALYAGYWLERFVRPLGDPESIKRITQNELQSRYDTHYTPTNMSIVGVGGMQLSELVELLAKSPFAINKKGFRTPLPTPAKDFALPSETRHIFEISKHMTVPAQAGGYRSVTKIPGDTQSNAIRILREMLNEVLNEEVREKRAWAYAIDSSRHNFRDFFEFSISCNGLAIKAIDQIEEVVEACVASIKDREDLFEKIKRQTIASNFMVDSTGKNICNGALKDLAEDQRITSLKEIERDLKRTSMSDVCNLLEWLRPERRWTLITKP